jgi:hypothetical protein
MIIPFPILVVLILLVIQLILVLFLKKYRKPLLLTLIPVLAAGVWLGIQEYNRTAADLTKVKPDVTITAVALIRDYEMNDSLADRKYLGRIVELRDRVKNTEADETGNYIIVLGEAENPSSVRCRMDTLYREQASAIQPGSSITIRGECTGYKKNEMMGINLGSDVELVRCVIIQTDDK